MKPAPPLRACTLDAMGTMLRLLPPWEQLDPELIEGLPPLQVETAFRREMAYYADHATEARDREALAGLRRRCAEILSEGLGRRIEVDPMMAAIRFEPFPEVQSALSDLTSRGLRLACISNWDFELSSVLERVGLARHFDVVVTSAQAGMAKPDPAIFAIALEELGVEPAEALHVGDSDADVDGASAAGIEALRVVRGSEEERADGATITSLSEISEHLRR